MMKYDVIREPSDKQLLPMTPPPPRKTIAAVHEDDNKISNKEFSLAKRQKKQTKYIKI